MIRRSIRQENITIINIYTHNIKALNYIKQILTEVKGEINSNTIIVGGFNTPLLTMDRESIRKLKV